MVMAVFTCPTSFVSCAAAGAAGFLRRGCGALIHSPVDMQTAVAEHEAAHVELIHEAEIVGFSWKTHGMEKCLQHTR